VIIESAGVDTVESAIDYTLGAGLENLTLTGSAVLGIGNSANNVLHGDAGANILVGGGGKDTMAGGDGADTFVVDRLAALVATIADFSQGQDRIGLAASSYGGLFTAGALTDGVLVNGTKATATAQRLVYDAMAGALYYDPDGSGAAARTQIAAF